MNLILHHVIIIKKGKMLPMIGKKKYATMTVYFGAVGDPEKYQINKFGGLC